MTTPAGRPPRRTLIVTIPPFDGGVPAKTAILAGHLQALGHQVTVAWYAAHGTEPELCAPSWRVLRGARPGQRARPCFGGVPGIAIGCWLPELEATYYLPSPAWSALLAGHDRHLAVGGNILVGYRLVRAGLPHLVWCGSPLLEDRIDRQRQMARPRRLFDRLAMVPVLQGLERRVLAGSDLILPVSTYSARRFTEMGRRRPMTVLPVPVDSDRFTPPAEPAPAGVYGLAGRIGDPRKNLGMLIEAVALVVGRGLEVTLRLTGEPDPGLRRQIAALGLEGRVHFTGVLARAALPDFYRSLDVFALPSWQEGLGIVGVEAMACGVPVVSTRNGGAEDYVIDGETGLLTGFTAAEMADRLARVIAGRDLRDRLSQAARQLAETRYGMPAWRAGVARAWEAVWGELP